MSGLLGIRHCIARDQSKENGSKKQCRTLHSSLMHVNSKQKCGEVQVSHSAIYSLGLYIQM